MPKLPTNLARIGSVYKFRTRIPQDLLQHYSPKKEIVESLHTKELSVAKRLLPIVQKRYHDEWEQIRQASFEAQLLAPINLNAPPPPLSLPINEETIEFVTTFLENSSLAGDEQTRLNGNYTLEEIQDYRERYTEALTLLRDLVSTGDTHSLRESVLQVLRIKNIELVGSEEDYRRLAIAYGRAAIRTNEALLAQMNGETVARPEIKVPRALGGGSKIPLYSLFEYWRDIVPGRSKRTVEDVERRIKAFDAMTQHKSAELLTKADFIAYRDHLIAEGKSHKTVSKDLSFIKAVMQLAADNDKIPSNPAALIKVPKAKGASGIKRELSADDIQKLFGSDIYTKHERPKAGGGEAAAWVPLIALYTGARLEEICQLLVTDVKTEGAISYFSIQLGDDDDGNTATKSLKNDESRRSVPIHQKLIDAGFMLYVEAMREQKQRWLFPLLKADQYDKRGGNFSKWWSRWRNGLGVGGSQRCFHAFRHAFKTACRGASIEEDFHDALTGHSSSSVGRKYGGFPLAALNTELQKISYPELEFNWVWSPLTKKLSAWQERQERIVERMQHRSKIKA